MIYSSNFLKALSTESLLMPLELKFNDDAQTYLENLEFTFGDLIKKYSLNINKDKMTFKRARDLLKMQNDVYLIFDFSITQIDISKGKIKLLVEIED